MTLDNISGPPVDVEKTVTSALSNKTRLIQIPFGQLLGIDQVMEKNLISVGIDLPLRIGIEAWKKAALILYLDTHPILVRQSTNGYYCIGGFRSFRLAQTLYSNNPDTPVLVLYRPGKLSSATRQQLLAVEIFADPAISRIDRTEAPHLYNLWRQLGSSSSIITGNTDQSFDMAMGFSPRNKKKNGIPKAK
jgi:hypothetical protein